MKLYDPSILALPLYEDHHRALAARVEAWADGMAERIESWPTLSPADMGRRFTRLLGDEGWFTAALRSDGSADFRAICLLREAFAYLHDLCDFAFAIQALAAAPVMFHGTPEQRHRWLPDILAGRRIGSLAISEAAAGSNVAALTLRADRQGDSYVLNGDKTWISNGDIADFHAVLVRTGEGPGALGLSVVLVEADRPGLVVAETIDALAPRSFATLGFRNCAVPVANRVGKGGGGFQIAMDVLERYRMTVGAAALGFARRARAAALGWARSRRVADNSLLFDLPTTRATLADSEVGLTAAALLIAQAAWELDQGSRGYAKHSSIAKLYASESAQRIIDDTVQLFGAAGIVRDSVPERLYRQIRALRIHDGTSEIQRMIIAGHLRTTAL